MEEIHEGFYGPHMNGIILANKIARQGYFWLTMETDCQKFMKKYYNCQTYSDVNHFPSIELQGMTFPWPFCSLGY